MLTLTLVTVAAVHVGQPLETGTGTVPLVEVMCVELEEAWLVDGDMVGEVVVAWLVEADEEA